MRQALFQDLHRGFGRIGETKQVQILGRDHVVPDQGLEVDNLVPIIRTVQHNQNLALQFLCLCESQYFGQLIKGAEAAWKNHQRFRQIRKPEFAHEEIVKFKAKLRGDVGVWALLERKADVEADGLAACVRRPAVRRLHDARPTPGANHEPMTRLRTAVGDRERRAPFRHRSRQLSRFVVIAAKRTVFLNASRAEEDNRVLNLLVLKMGERPKVFRQNPQGPRIRTLQKRLFAIGKRAPKRLDRNVRHRALVFRVRQTSIVSPGVRTDAPAVRIRAMPGRNVFTVLETTAAQYGDATALHQPVGTKANRSYETYSWNDWVRISREIGLGLRELGAAKGEIVCILSDTRAEFYLVDLGIMGVGSVSGALYTAYPMPDLARDVKRTESRFLFIEDPKTLAKLAQAIEAQGGNLPPHTILMTGEQPGVMT